MKEEKDQGGFYPRFGQNQGFIFGVHKGIDQMGKHLTQQGINKVFTDGFNLWKQEHQFQYQNFFNPHEEYVMLSVADMQMAVDMPVNSNKLVLWEKHGENFQRWKIKFSSNHYTMVNVDGKLLAIEGASTQNGANVIAHKENDSASEKWDFVPVGEGNKFFIRTFSGKCLELSGTENRNPLIQAQFEGKPTQQFVIKPRLNTNTLGQNREYYILSKINKNLALDINSTDEHQNVIWEKNGGKTQRFRIRLQGEKFSIQTFNGARMKITDCSTENCAVVKMGGPSNTDDQLWELVPVQGVKNAYFIKSFCGKCLDIEGGDGKNGGRILQYDHHGGDNQIWYIQQA